MKEFFSIYKSKHDFRITGLLFAFIFLVIAVFQIIKPLKNGLFVESYGAHVELYAKLANVVLAAIGVAAFTLLYNRLPRQRFISALSAIFVSSFIGLALALGDDPKPFATWALYLVGDLEVTMMVAAFWAYLTDLARGPATQPFMGPIGAGGVLGGWAGSSIAKFLLGSIGTQGLLFLAAGLMGVVILITTVIELMIHESQTFKSTARLYAAPKGTRAAPGRLHEAFEGARLVLQSPYLMGIAGIMGFYEIASQLVDYQFKLAAQSMTGVRATQSLLAEIYMYSSLLSVIAQFILVGTIMKRFGPGPMLLVLPVAITAGSLGFLAIPTLGLVSLLIILDNGLNYSIQQTGRELLYLATTHEEKYKARAFISMFVQRFAKSLSIFAVLALSALGITAHVLSLITIGVMGLLVWLSVYVGHRYEQTISRATPQSGPYKNGTVSPSENSYPLAANA